MNDCIFMNKLIVLIVSTSNAHLLLMIRSSPPPSIFIEICKMLVHGDTKDIENTNFNPRFEREMNGLIGGDHKEH